MNRNNLSMVILIWLCLAANVSLAQSKYEREAKIKSRDVVSTAVEYIDALTLDSKIQWYKETRLEGFSYEAKFKLDDYKYSIEFDSSGIIEDIEKTIQWKELPTDIQEAICDHLNSRFDHFKIGKIQIQYSGDIMKLGGLSKLPAIPSVITSYELVVDVKESKERSSREFLYDAQGILVSEFKIIKRITDNMDF